jgi:hypothetical protein
VAQDRCESHRLGLHVFNNGFSYLQSL